MGLDDDPRRGFDVRMRILIGPMRRLYLERDAVRIRLLRAGHVIDTAVVRSDNEQIDADVPLAMDDIVEERVVPPPRDDGVLERARSDPGVSPRASYVELPAACAPLVGAAREVVGTEQNPWRQAQWLVRWLRSDVFTYTLEMPVVDSRRPVVDFVLEARHGHCEYFASALTLMLRALGHPARIVRGFRGGDFLERRGVWVVRGSNYHAWTEMYFDGPGWVALDATPPDERASDAVTRTRAADETVEDGGDDPGWLARLLGLDPERVARIAETIRDLLERFVLSPLRFLFGSDGGFLGLVLLILLLARLQHRRRAEAWRREAGARTRREAEAPYLAALRVLRGAGVRRRSSQTPREFLRDIVLWAPEVGPDMRWLTSAHERVRYGQVPESSEVREEASTRSARVKAEVRTHRRR
jgi:hypothetical protein